jgi:murein DD-endopeptidase MepM/ murein hydrolase activator NlpD
MAAVEADRVVVALIGDTKALDGPVNASTRQFDRNMSTIEQSATRAEKQIVRSAGAIAAGQRNLGRQIADVGTQLGSGSSPFIILAQQLPQVADAVTDMGGKFGKVASFLTTPWGAAALAATTVLVPLVAGLFKTGNEVDALVEKMRQQARQAENNRAAEDAWRITIEGVTEAIRKRREEQEKSLKTDQQAEQQALANARGELVTQRDNLSQAQRDLAKAKRDLVDLQALTQGGGRGGVGGETVAVDAQERKISALQQRVTNLRRSISEAEASVRGAEIPIGEREVEGRVDAAAAATNRYTAALGRLREERQRGAITQKQYNDQLEVERRKRDAAIKAAQDARSSRSDADTVPFLRPVSGGSTSGRYGEKRGVRGHGGIDIAVPVGTSVSAAAAGTIIESGTLPGYGNVVIIDHGRGTTTRYAHLSKLLAAKGDTVSAGDAIGLSGGRRGAAGAGNSQGPHLHYEVRRNGRPVDPSGAAFPIDPATARKVKDTIKEDFDKLWEDLAGGANTAREKITTEFEAIEGGIDPTTAIARELQGTLDKIARASLIGIVDDARAAELQLKATQRAASDLLGSVIGIEGLRAGAGVEKQDLDDREAKDREAEDRLQARREDHVADLAGLYETLFTGGTMNLWDEFKQQGLRALAALAAQQTFKLITGNSVSLGGGALGGGIFGSLLGSIFGLAGGGHAGPGSIHRVNEHKGGVELLRMGSQGGEVIPLGQSKASSPGVSANRIYYISVSADNSVTPAGFARGLAAEILGEAQRMDAQASQATLRAVPGAISKANRYGG